MASASYTPLGSQHAEDGALALQSLHGDGEDDLSNARTMSSMMPTTHRGCFVEPERVGFAYSLSSRRSASISVGGHRLFSTATP